MKRSPALIASLLALATAVVAAMDLPPPTQLQCEYRPGLQIVDTATPRLTWELALAADGQGWQPSGHQLQVASRRDQLLAGQPDLWDTGPLKPYANNAIYAGPAVPPGQDAWWRVRAFTADGTATAWSAPARWVAGPAATDWAGAHWIGALSTEQAKLPPHTRHGAVVSFSDADIKDWQNLPELASRSLLLRKNFSLPAPPIRAVAFITGLGQYELSVNGQPASTDLFQPAWSDYDKTVYYNAIDVTARLTAGENVLGVWLGNGFFNVTGGRYAKYHGSFGTPRLLVRLAIDCADGSKHTVFSDGSWRWSRSPVTYNCIYGGEDYDARQLPAGWDRPGFDARAWAAAVQVEAPHGVLRAQTSPGLTIRKTYPLVERRATAPGVTFLDFGQNLAGFPQLTIDGPAGATLKFFPSEAIDPARRVTQDHLRRTGTHVLAPVSLNFTASGKGPETWRPRFHYYGYRYAEITGDAKLIDATSNFLQLDVPDVGTFACSNDTINQIHRLIVAAIRSNLQHVLTDCPHREKLGWLEVPHLMGPAIQYNFASGGFFAKISQDLIDSQENSGLVPDISPEYVIFREGFRDSPEWGAAAVLIPWEHYLWHGDPRIIRRSYPTMVAYVDYLQSTAKDGLIMHGLGDWGDVGPKRPGISQQTSPGVTGTAIYHQCLRALATMGKVIGRPQAELERFDRMAAAARAAFHTKFFVADKGHYDRGSQAAQAMALALGLVPAEHRAAVFQTLKNDFASRGYMPTTGEVGLRYVIQAFADAGDSETIFQLATQTNGPGFAYQVSQGLTTLAEAWDVNPTKSQNHCMLGHIEQWFYSHVAGLQPLETHPGWTHIRIAPTPVGDITWARAKHQSPMGEFSVDWKIEAGIFSLTATIPPGATAEFALPAGELLGNSPNGVCAGGTHHFKIKLAPAPRQ